MVAEVRPSPNHGERKTGAKPDMIVLHYTGMRDSQAAINLLCTPASEVSAHYVVLEDGYIVQLVSEERRAWHAGASSWAGETDINSCSIGIEIANAGHEQTFLYNETSVPVVVDFLKGTDVSARRITYPPLRFVALEGAPGAGSHPSARR